MNSYPGRVALQQRVLPTYRALFFDTLAASCEGGLSVFAGEPRPRESIKTTQELKVARYAPAGNLHFLDRSLYLCWQRGFMRWLQDWQPAVLIVEANPRYPNTRRAVGWMHAQSRPVVGWGLGAPPLSGLLAPGRKAARLRFLRSFDALIAYSQRGASEYRELGIPAERVFLAQNAAVPRPSSPPPERPPVFEGRGTVLFVGRIQVRKRLDNLLKACAYLPGELQPNLLVIGDGPAHTQLEEMSHVVYPRARFLGAKHGPDLDAFFKKADLFVLPGTGGLAIQHAMSYGLPIIVAQGDGTQEDLVRPGNGWLVPPDNLEALSRALLEALSHPHRLRTMGAESYRIASEEINLDTMVDAFVEVLNRVG